MKEGTEATKEHNYPFFLEITKALTDQISKINDKLYPYQSAPAAQKPSSEETSSPSKAESKIFESVVKKFFEAIDLAPCHTTKEVESVLKNPVKKPEDNEVRENLQKGTQKGLSLVLLDYLSKPENMEDFLCKVCKSIEIPLSGKNIPKSSPEWVRLTTEYDAAQNKLKETGSSLTHKIIDETIRDKVRGGSNPEVSKQRAQEIFEAHKNRGIRASEKLPAICGLVNEKIKKSNPEKGPVVEIHSELNEIVLKLKEYENKEAVVIQLEQNPETAPLSPADKESILRQLFPCYKLANGIMDFVLVLQASQKEFTFHSNVWTKLTRIEEEFKEFVEFKEKLSKNPLTSVDSLVSAINRAAAHLEEIKAALSEEIKKLQPHLKPELEELKGGIKNLEGSFGSIRENLQEITKRQKPIEALNTLQPFPIDGKRTEPGLIDRFNQLVQRGDYIPVDKWQCLRNIRRKLKAADFGSSEQEQIVNLLNKLRRDHRPNANRDLWNAISNLLEPRKRFLETERNRAGDRLKENVQNSDKLYTAEKNNEDGLRKAAWGNMVNEGKKLHEAAKVLDGEIKGVKKESLTLLDDAELGKLGWLAGILAGLWSPELGVGVTCISLLASRIYYNNRQVKKMEGAKKFGAVLAAPFIANCASWYFRGKLITLNDGLPWLGANDRLLPTIAAAGAATSAQYAASNLLEEVIKIETKEAALEVDRITKLTCDEVLTKPNLINAFIRHAIINALIRAFPPVNKI